MIEHAATLRLRLVKAPVAECQSVDLCLNFRVVGRGSGEGSAGVRTAVVDVQPTPVEHGLGLDRAHEAQHLRRVRSHAAPILRHEQARPSFACDAWHSLLT
eukprot:6204090-Pleurochrysis_carterae.AAC.2